MPRVRRRRQLLAAAQEVFVSRGYHAAAMDEIADRAGVSKPVLYQHFPGKLELYLALLEEHSEALVEKQREALESTDDNRQRVTASFQAYFDFVAGDGEAFRLVFESDLRNLPAVREKSEQTFRRCAELIGEVIRQDTSISDDEAHLLSIALVGMAETSARYWLNNEGSIPKDAAEQLVARLAWRGISGWDLTRSAEEDGS
ncbi:bacterial regulatory s, tetR family protein [Nocardiopsis alba ATCC BAA-2165]|uniref:Bacterial regulatory s, tetR family protein n=1 Tax=Nocardiopsis alba (strain ATCC BAA-2165 / BE74) TaxID=1205910 RepID=J7LDE3_NOCAA|nr:TetR/AcrR family transcriptional regulator [Nocardiopsis alba]AFR09440.1 bacterial regulatory s, tetR family protein [Nocardiopsis alba ATCC BAA-2165]